MPSNMPSKFFTRSTFQPDKSWSKEDAPENIKLMSVTRRVFHSPMFWSNRAATMNVPNALVTLLRLVERVLFVRGVMDVVRSLKRVLLWYFAGGELVKLNEEARRTWCAPSS